MKKLLLTVTLATCGAMAARAGAPWSVNVQIGSAPYYGYAPADVVYVERYVPYYEVPHVLVVSRYARVRPSVIVGHYRGGWGWDRICNRYGVPRSVVYGSGYSYGPSYGRPDGYAYGRSYGPPYGNAYGHYKFKGKNKHRGRW
ncbi:MAG: hypothetical protein ACRD8O_18040 [Bryobacteraceae bacterium]